VNRDFHFGPAAQRSIHQSASFGPLRASFFHTWNPITSSTLRKWSFCRFRVSKLFLERPSLPRPRRHALLVLAGPALRPASRPTWPPAASYRYALPISEIGSPPASIPNSKLPLLARSPRRSPHPRSPPNTATRPLKRSITASASKAIPSPRPKYSSTWQTPPAKHLVLVGRCFNNYTGDPVFTGKSAMITVIGATGVDGLCSHRSRPYPPPTNIAATGCTAPAT